MPALLHNKVKVTYTVRDAKNVVKSGNRLKMLPPAGEGIVAVFLTSKNSARAANFI